MGIASVNIYAGAIIVYIIAVWRIWIRLWSWCTPIPVAWLRSWNEIKGAGP